MTPSTKSMKQGTCGCGRSPSGDCCGWHSLSEDQYREKLAEYENKNLSLQQDLFTAPDQD